MSSSHRRPPWIGVREGGEKEGCHRVVTPARLLLLLPQHSLVSLLPNPEVVVKVLKEVGDVEDKSDDA